MKKEKKIMIGTISAMAFILVCVMFMQFKVVNETDIAQIEIMRKDELEEAITEWKDKYEEAYQKLLDTNKKINEYNSKIQSNAETKELIEKELLEAKKNFGLTDVMGDGIIITLIDSDEVAYDADDILELINELRNAGAEAISINGQRVVNTTDIAQISATIVKVNSKNISSPYEIRVIGDEMYLKSALTIKNGYYDLKVKNGYEIKIMEEKNIKINKYSKALNVKYIELN